MIHIYKVRASAFIRAARIAANPNNRTNFAYVTVMHHPDHIIYIASQYPRVDPFTRVDATTRTYQPQAYFKVVFQTRMEITRHD